MKLMIMMVKLLVLVLEYFMIAAEPELFMETMKIIQLLFALIMDCPLV